MSRYHGLGVDNVVSFNVVLADGSLVVADKCSHPDLFWALRGGGGGTFGVVTSAVYRVHETMGVSYINIVIGDQNGAAPVSLWRKWLDFWIEQSAALDSKHGAYWSYTFVHMYYLGPMSGRLCACLYKKPFARLGCSAGLAHPAAAFKQPWGWLCWAFKQSCVSAFIKPYKLLPIYYLHFQGHPS